MEKAERAEKAGKAEKDMSKKGRQRGKKEFDFRGKGIIIDDEDVDMLEDVEEIRVSSRERELTKDSSIIAIDDS